MAMHFGWWIPFEREIELARLSEFGLRGHPQLRRAVAR
jgi:hypothetical protein